MNIIKLIKKSFYFAILIFCLITLPGISQDSNFVLQKVIPFQTVDFSLNKIGELFLINQSNELKKIDSKGDSIGVYNEVSKYGKLSSVNAENPFRTLLFYKDFSTLILLDKYLNEVSNINLRKANIFQVNVVTSSFDNNIWLFDGQEQKLKKIDESGKLLLESTDFRQIFNMAISPVALKEKEGGLFLYDPLHGMFIFDHYGSFKKKILFIGWLGFEVSGNSIYGFDGKYIYQYTLGSMDVHKINLPSGPYPYSSFQIVNNKIYLLSHGSISYFQMGKTLL